MLYFPNTFCSLFDFVVFHSPSNLKGRELKEWWYITKNYQCPKKQTEKMCYRLCRDRALSIQFMSWLSNKNHWKKKNNCDFGNFPNVSCVLLEKLPSLMAKHRWPGVGYGRGEPKMIDLIKIYGKSHQTRNHHHVCSTLYLFLYRWQVCI